MTSKKIFTMVNKNKLRALYTSLLKTAIEQKEDAYKQEGVVFNIKKDVLRVCRSVTPNACRSYLQGLALEIPFEDYKIQQEILNFLQIEDGEDENYTDTDAIIDQYWDGISLQLSVLLRREY